MSLQCKVVLPVQTDDDLTNVGDDDNHDVNVTDEKLELESCDDTDKVVSGASDTLETTAVTLNATADKLRQEQLEDQTLNGCRALCNRGKGGFFLKNGIMYRHTKIIGRPVEQLVVPQPRRAEVLRLVHDTFGAHQSALNTAHRIQYSMWFPSLMQACKQYTMSCEVCCRRARETCYDRVPIKPIERDDVSFNHWMCDFAGPFWPNQNKSHNYCFVACDSKTRWPAAFALRTVNAQTICDCLLKLWSVFGVSQFVSFDNATYNTSKLTQTLMKLMGSSPIFITPHHSQGNAIAEKLVN